MRIQDVKISDADRQRILHFKKRHTSLYGEGHFIFACHAAFPVSFTPDMLYRIWLNFGTYPDKDHHDLVLNIDSVAVSDLLLSNICHEVGVDLYEMDKEVRRHLLDELQEDRRFGQNRLEMLADFLYQYAEQAYKHPLEKNFKDTHQWTALAVSRPRQAVEQIARALSKAIEEKKTGEQLRLFLLIDTFVKDEKAFEELFQFSKGLKEHIHGKTGYTVKMPVLTRSPRPEGINLLTLPIPKTLKGKIERIVPAVNKDILERIRKTKKKNLTDLNLMNSGLTYIPDEIFQLQQLEDLDLSDNTIEVVPPGIRKLSNLKELHLNNNNLSKLPGEITELSKLKILRLNNNRLTQLPEGISKLNNLKILDLSNNQFTQFPKEILEFDLDLIWEGRPGVDGIILGSNPFEVPPVEIVRQGKDAIKEYFESLEIKTYPLNEIKVLVVGDGGAGKTSLVKSLRGLPFDPSEPMTHDIDINDVEIEAGEEKVKIHIWDFGGQEIMHATHQFFLSKRSLYILVLDDRKDDKTEYWLKHIESFGGDSPVLLVINKIDQNLDFDINRKYLQEKYPNIKGFFKISCLTGEGIDSFIDSLSRHLMQIERLKTTWPKSWFNVRNILENLKEEFITYEKYKAICLAEKINDSASQQTLIDFLNDLGLVLHFDDPPLKETVIVNPEWIIGAIYQIINSRVLTENKGIFPKVGLKQILDTKKYPVPGHDFIIELMKKFELCFSINAETILFPDLLPVEEPIFDFDYSTSLKFILEYDFLPRSIMPRFIARMNKDIKGKLRWRTGVVLENKDFLSTAVIKPDEPARRIYIHVNGEQKSEYFSIIRHTLNDINKGFERLEVVEKLPLPDNPEITVSYNHLIYLEEKGIETFLPEGASKEYKVKELLNGLEFITAEQRKILDEWNSLKTSLNKQKKLTEGQIKSFITNFSKFIGLNVKEEEKTKGIDHYLIIDIRNLNIGIIDEAFCFSQDKRELTKDDIIKVERLAVELAMDSQTKLSLFFCFQKDELIENFAEKTYLSLVPIYENDFREIVLSQRPLEIFRRTILNRISLYKISPYHIAGPATTTFYGRSDIINRIVSSYNKSFAIVGARKIGKTSLLLKIECNPPPNTVYVFLDLDLVMTGGFTKKIYNDFLKSLEHEIGRIFNTKITFGGFFSGKNLSRLPEVIQQLSQQSGKRIVFILNEIDYLLAFDKKNDYKLMRIFRAMSQKNYCQFIFGGFKELYFQGRDISSPVYNFFEEIRLMPLDKDSALDLITKPMESIGVRYKNPGDRQLILEYTGCHPNLLHFFCKMLVEKIERHEKIEDRRTIFREDIEAVFSIKYEKYIIDDVYMFFSDLSDIERFVLILLAERKANGKSFSFDGIRDLLRKYDIAIPLDVLHRNLRNLVMRFILIEEGRDQYSFAMPVFPDMLRKSVDENFKIRLIKEIKSAGGERKRR